MFALWFFGKSSWVCRDEMEGARICVGALQKLVMGGRGEGYNRSIFYLFAHRPKIRFFLVLFALYFVWAYVDQYRRCDE